jgi:hypothetical protein
MGIETGLKIFDKKNYGSKNVLYGDWVSIIGNGLLGNIGILCAMSIQINGGMQR